MQSFNLYCFTFVTGYHRVDTGFRLRLMGIGKTKEVKPLTEEMAVDLGADMLGEIFIFVTGVGVIAAEYCRQSRKEATHESSQDVRLRNLEETVMDMRFTVEEQSAQIRELNRLVLSLPQKLPDTIKDGKTGTVLKVDKG